MREANAVVLRMVLVYLAWIEAVVLRGCLPLDTAAIIILAHHHLQHAT